jgi:hypothetical protein
VNQKALVQMNQWGALVATGFNWHILPFAEFCYLNSFIPPG